MITSNQSACSNLLTSAPKENRNKSDNQHINFVNDFGTDGDTSLLIDIECTSESKLQEAISIIDKNVDEVSTKLHKITQLIKISYKYEFEPINDIKW